MRKTIHTESENPIVGRITDQLIHQGKTQKQLTEYIGGTQGMYSDWKSGRMRSYERYMDKIADFLNVSKTYLLTGRDDDPDEAELIKIYRHMDKERRRKLLMIAQTI